MAIGPLRSPLRCLPLGLPLAVLLAFCLAGGAIAGDEDAPREVWRFQKGGVVREVDVTAMPAFVRDAVAKRLEADGFERIADTGARDLEADVRELVRRGGQFAPRPAEAIFLGVPVRPVRGPEGGWILQFLGSREGALATALGLGSGDRVLALDGRAPSPATLGDLAGVEFRPGQLRLQVRRREGRVENWTLTFSRGAPPESR